MSVVVPLETVVDVAKDCANRVAPEVSVMSTHTV